METGNIKCLEQEFGLKRLWSGIEAAGAQTVTPAETSFNLLFAQILCISHSQIWLLRPQKELICLCVVGARSVPVNPGPRGWPLP